MLVSSIEASTARAQLKGPHLSSFERMQTQQHVSPEMLSTDNASLKTQTDLSKSF